MPRTAIAKAPALKASRARKAPETTLAPAPAMTAATPEPATTADPPQAEAPAPSPASPAAAPNKLAALVALLRREQGATLADMTEVTGWQVHSVRGAISGSLKKKQGLDVTSTKADGVRTYSIAP